MGGISNELHNALIAMKDLSEYVRQIYQDIILCADLENFQVRIRWYFTFGQISSISYQIYYFYYYYFIILFYIIILEINSRMEFEWPISRIIFHKFKRIWSTGAVRRIENHFPASAGQIALRLSLHTRIATLRQKGKKELF